jgi:hypothetical protein
MDGAPMSICILGLQANLAVILASQARSALVPCDRELPLLYRRNYLVDVHGTVVESMLTTIG